LSRSKKAALGPTGAESSPTRPTRGVVAVSEVVRTAWR
jgi:hypothetical protein